jgi:hypothetical protein
MENRATVQGMPDSPRPLTPPLFHDVWYAVALNVPEAESKEVSQCLSV